MNEGADLVGVGRVGIAYPDWPLGLQKSHYSPDPPPFANDGCGPPRPAILIIGVIILCEIN